jgi:hypothetical protein
VIAFLVSITTMSAALSAPRPLEQPMSNPDLTKACGLNVLMILDESGSIATSGATQDVKNAFKALTDALKNTSSAMAVAEFSKVARLPVIGSFPPGAYITITDSTKSDLDAYINQDYKPGAIRTGKTGCGWASPTSRPATISRFPI